MITHFIRTHVDHWFHIKTVALVGLFLFAGTASAQDDFLESLLGKDAETQAIQPADATAAAQPETQPEQPATVPASEASAQPDPQSQPSSTAPSPEALATIKVQPAAPPSSTHRQIEEIVVTATKRETTARDIPVSISAFKGSDLMDQGATDLDGILKNTPGVEVNGSHIDIRGVTLTSGQSIGAAAEAGRFLGDVSLNAPSIAGGSGDFDPYDMSTVEVLKGPQSTLFGGTALSGAIRYVPNKPDFGGFALGLRGGYGDITEADARFRELSAVVNIPISDTFALRAAGTLRYKPNIIKDLYGHRDDNDNKRLDQFRYMARWQATEQLSFDLTYLDFKSANEFTYLDNPSRYETNTKRIEEPKVDVSRVASLNAQYAFEEFSLVGVVNYLKNGENFVIDTSPVLGITDLVGAAPVVQVSSARVPSFELRLVSNSPSESDWSVLEDWDYLIGLYYMKADQRVDQVLTILNIPSSHVQYAVDVSEKALFVNLTRHLFDNQLEWNMGARMARTNLNSDVHVTTAVAVTREYVSNVPDKRINPSAALTWHITDDVNIRGSYSQGFRFGGANSAITIGIEDIQPTFKSDSLRNYEIGLRSDWFDNSLRLDVTGYRILWTDLQLTQVSPVAQPYVSNVGGAQIDGIEAQLTWQIPSDWSFIPDGLTLNSSFSILNARTTEDFDSANGAAAKGTRLPLSPKRSGLLGLSWERSWNEFDFRSSVQASFASDRTNDLIETYRFPSSKNCTASFRVANKSWVGAPSLSLIGTNLTNEFKLYNATPVTAKPGNFVFVPQGTPRTIKLNLEFNFN